MKAASSPTRFVCTFSDEGCWVELRDDSGTSVSPERWIATATPFEVPQAAHLVALAEDGRAETSAEGIFLPSATVAALSDVVGESAESSPTGSIRARASCEGYSERSIVSVRDPLVPPRWPPTIDRRGSRR